MVKVNGRRYRKLWRNVEQSTRLLKSGGGLGAIIKRTANLGKGETLVESTAKFRLANGSCSFSIRKAKKDIQVGKRNPHRLGGNQF
jgi:hypothetical protein